MTGGLLERLPASAPGAKAIREAKARAARRFLGAWSLLRVRNMTKSPFGNPAIPLLLQAGGPEALRPRLATGLPLLKLASVFSW